MAVQNPHRIDLGDALERFRIRAGLTTKQLEATAGWGAGKASRVEDGKRTLSDKDVGTLAKILELAPAEADELKALAALARKRSAAPFVADYSATYVAFEQAAVKLDYYSDELIPGIAQDPTYAAAVLACSDPDKIAERVAGRLERQKVLVRGNPPHVRLLLGEAALHRRVGGTVGLRQQMERLLELGDMSSFETRIVPFSLGAHRAIGGRFSVVHVAKDARVYVEGVLDAMYLHKPEDVAAYEEIFAELWPRAADGATSATMLRKRIQQLA